MAVSGGQLQTDCGLVQIVEPELLHVLLAS